MTLAPKIGMNDRKEGSSSVRNDHLHATMCKMFETQALTWFQRQNYKRKILLMNCISCQLSNCPELPQQLWSWQKILQNSLHPRPHLHALMYDTRSARSPGFFRPANTSVQNVRNPSLDLVSKDKITKEKFL